MRILFMLLTFVWFFWLMGRFLKSPKRMDQASTARRKKVESVVIEKQKDRDCGDDKQ